MPFVLAPLELIARGVKGISKGDRKNGLSILGIGLYIAAVTAFSFIGGLAIETERFGPAAWPAIIFSLLGLPGAYEVESEVLLWVARLLAVLLISVPLSSQYLRFGVRKDSAKA